MYDYMATIGRVVDGDTVWAEVDLGMDVKLRVTLRLEGIDTPEMREEGGPEAKQYLQQLIGWMEGTYGPVVRLQTLKDRREKYGRYRAILFNVMEKDLSWEKSINMRMVTDGHAVEASY